MLTRLEAHGFKNLLGFRTDFGPFTCLAGPNGVGKSNIFDAIRFLSLLAHNKTLMEAALAVRGTDPETSDLRELFWTDGERQLDRFALAAEMIVEPEVEDDFGRQAKASSTYLRYEISIGYEPPEGHGHLGRLVLLSEELDYFTQNEAVHKLRFPLSPGRFRRAVVHNQRRSGKYISTRNAAGITEILVHQDGGSSGSPKANAATAPRSIIATSNTSATPTILAARREMQSWRLLALEPSAMRSADRFHSDQHVAANGAHLPATLYRLASKAEQAGEDPEQIYSRIAAKLARLVPVDALRVNVDDVRQLLTVEARENSGIRLPARSLSDGTLRFLTLCILNEDPEVRGVICMEEPENGIHPAKIGAMVELLRELPVDPLDLPGPENPLRQVVVATHSPPFVQLQEKEDLLFATEVQVRSPFGEPTSTLRCRPLEKTWRTQAPGQEGRPERGVGMSTVLSYLSDPPGAQLVLPILQKA